MVKNHVFATYGVPYAKAIHVNGTRLLFTSKNESLREVRDIVSTTPVPNPGSAAVPEYIWLGIEWRHAYGLCNQGIK